MHCEVLMLITTDCFERLECIVMSAFSVPDNFGGSVLLSTISLTPAVSCCKTVVHHNWQMACMPTSSDSYSSDSYSSDKHYYSVNQEILCR